MRSVWLGLIGAVVLSFSAYAGCIGGAVGDDCIGIGTPSEHHHCEPPVVIERHHRDPVTIEHRHENDEDDTYSDE
jgi:hypothetical protein